MSFTLYETICYYVLLGVTALSVSVQIRNLRLARAGVQDVRWLLSLSPEELKRLRLEPPKGGKYVQDVAEAAERAEWYRLAQHGALFLILALPLPLPYLQHWVRGYPWVSFSVEAGGLLVIPLLLLVTSLNTERLQRGLNK